MFCSFTSLYISILSISLPLNELGLIRLRSSTQLERRNLWYPRMNPYPTQHGWLKSTWVNLSAGPIHMASNHVSFQALDSLIPSPSSSEMLGIPNAPSIVEGLTSRMSLQLYNTQHPNNPYNCQRACPPNCLFNPIVLDFPLNSVSQVHTTLRIICPSKKHGPLSTLVWWV